MYDTAFNTKFFYIKKTILLRGKKLQKPLSVSTTQLPTHCKRVFSAYIALQTNGWNVTVVHEFPRAKFNASQLLLVTFILLYQ